MIEFEVTSSVSRFPMCQFQMVIDALLLCFVADTEDNDGPDGRPYASERLRVSNISQMENLEKFVLDFVNII